MLCVILITIFSTFYPAYLVMDTTKRITPSHTRTNPSN